MLDRLLEIGSLFDWISPMLAFVQDWINGPSHTFLVPMPCAWSGRDIERLLGQYGVRVWGLMIVRGKLLLTVRNAQARWAQYLLDREDIQVQNRFAEQGGHRTRGKPRPTEKQSLVQTVDGWLKKLV